MVISEPREHGSLESFFGFTLKFLVKFFLARAEKDGNEQKNQQQTTNSEKYSHDGKSLSVQ